MREPLVSICCIAYNFFPYSGSLYLVIALLGLFLIPKKNHSKIPVFFLLILIVIFFVNIIDSSNPQDAFYSLATTVLFAFYLGKDDKINVYYMLNSLCLASLVISAIYFINYDKFLISYNASEGLDRAGWTDPKKFLYQL